MEVRREQGTKVGWFIRNDAWNVAIGGEIVDTRSTDAQVVNENKRDVEKVMQSIYIGMFKRRLYMQESEQLQLSKAKVVGHIIDETSTKSFIHILCRQIAMHRILLIPGTSLHNKCMPFVYLPLDLHMVLDEEQFNVLQNLIKFPAVWSWILEFGS